ncbi:MAG: hypothetical protein DME90_11560, partial [Verrucomicrobia bacterium]
GRQSATLRKAEKAAARNLPGCGLAQPKVPLNMRAAGRHQRKRCHDMQNERPRDALLGHARQPRRKPPARANAAANMAW